MGRVFAIWLLGVLTWLAGGVAALGWAVVGLEVAGLAQPSAGLLVLAVGVGLGGLWGYWQGLAWTARVWRKLESCTTSSSRKF